MSLSVFALAVVLSLLPRRYGCLVVVGVGCAVGGFASAFALVGVFPEWSGVALVFGASGSGTAVLAVVEGLNVALSFAPPEF